MKRRVHVLRRVCMASLVAAFIAVCALAALSRLGPVPLGSYSAGPARAWFFSAHQGLFCLKLREARNPLAIAGAVIDVRHEDRPHVLYSSGTNVELTLFPDEREPSGRTAVYRRDYTYDTPAGPGPGIFVYVRMFSLYVPLWFAAAAVVLPALAVWIVGRFVDRNPRGFCTSCGYDLRASPERCPECGTPPPDHFTPAVS
jgi:hypothetical protein